MTVYVNHSHPNGLTVTEYEALVKKSPEVAKRPWTVMRRDAGVYVRGTVKHPDHSTIFLNGWHQVSLSNETSNRFNAFLD